MGNLARAFAAALCCVRVGVATLCLRAPRCPSANGIAQTATSESKISALQRRCALMEEFCFFMVLSLVICEIRGSNPRRVLVGVHRGDMVVAKNARARQHFS